MLLSSFYISPPQGDEHPSSTRSSHHKSSWSCHKLKSKNKWSQLKQHSYLQRPDEEHSPLPGPPVTRTQNNPPGWGQRVPTGESGHSYSNLATVVSRGHTGPRMGHSYTASWSQGIPCGAPELCPLLSRNEKSAHIGNLSSCLHLSAMRGRPCLPPEIVPEEANDRLCREETESCIDTNI